MVIIIIIIVVMIGTENFSESSTEHNLILLHYCTISFGLFRIQGHDPLVGLD